MKIRMTIFLSLILLTTAIAGKENPDRDFIISCMEFPESSFIVGSLLNNPFFTINLGDKRPASEIKKSILLKETNLNINSDDFNVYYDIANLYREINDYRNAVKYYNKALEKLDKTVINNDGFTRQLFIKGELYYYLSESGTNTEREFNLEKGIKYLTDYTQLNPLDSKAFLILGDCYLSLGKINESLYCYNRVLSLEQKEFKIYPRLQAAEFQRDFLKLSKLSSFDKIKNINITEDFNFDYIQTTINNSDDISKEFYILQHHVYLIRLLVLKSSYYFRSKTDTSPELTSIFTVKEKNLIKETELLINGLDERVTVKSEFKYLICILKYLQSDYKKANDSLLSLFKEEYKQHDILDDILFINSSVIKDDSTTKDILKEMVKIIPDVRHYLLLSEIEYRNGNFNQSELLCRESLKLNIEFPEAYSGLAVISALKGNYTEGDDLIRKGNLIIYRNNAKKELFNKMRINEAAIALLKNEKERASVLLRNVLSVDNNNKGLQLYRRYFIKK